LRLADDAKVEFWLPTKAAGCAYKRAGREELRAFVVDGKKSVKVRFYQTNPRMSRVKMDVNSLSLLSYALKRP